MYIWFMKGVSQLIREHEAALPEAEFNDDFLRYHRTQIEFLQHERLVHLIVMLAIGLLCIGFLVLFLAFDSLSFIALFALTLILTVCYILHYFKLENTVIRWYFLYNQALKHSSPPHIQVD